LIGETGTTNFGVVDITYPANIRFQAQVYYGSIGYATASTLGMEIARKEVAKRDGGNEGTGRTVLVTGDGSMALTIQEIGTMIKQKLKVVIFVINNEGYTVERLIWGARQRTYIPFTPTPQTSFNVHLYVY
jgi:pyruvate decarboxylase